MKQKSPYIASKRPNLKSIKEDIRNYHWVMFKHAMEFLKQCPSLHKPFLQHYFISFMKDLLTKNLSAHYELLVRKIAKLPR
jgi:hypothetical protein